MNPYQMDLPTVPDHSVFDEYSEIVAVACKRTWTQYKTWVMMGILGIIMTVITVVILLSKNNSTLPCFTYTDQSLASTVSVDCLNFLWSAYCTTSPYTFPPSYTGFWNRSPQGGTLIRCITPQSTDCGAGSYQAIYVYMKQCNEGFGGAP